MKKTLILVVLAFLLTARLEAVPGQESSKANVVSDSVTEESSKEAYSPLLIPNLQAAGGDTIVNCWNCHDGKVALIYTPEIHKIHQGLLIAGTSQNYTDAVARGKFYLALSVHNPLGIEVGKAEQSLRKHLDLEENQGLVVLSAPDESEGAKIGLKPFDVLISIDQHQIASGEQLQTALKNLAEKDVTFLLMREGKMVTFSAKLPSFVTLDYALAVSAESKYEPQLSTDAPFRIGVTLKELDAPLRLHLKLESGGLMISDVVPDSPAATAGLQPNDVLVRCNDRPIITVEEINQMIQEIKSNPAKLSLIRAGDPIEVEVTPRQESANTFAIATAGEGTLSLGQRFIGQRLKDSIIMDQALDFRIHYQPENEPYQKELDAIQKALDDLKARISASNAATADKEAEPNSKPSEAPK